MVVGSK